MCITKPPKRTAGILTALLLSLLLTACGTRQTATPQPEGGIPEASVPAQDTEPSKILPLPHTPLQAVLLDDAPFIQTESGQTLSLSRFHEFERWDGSATVTIPQFAVADLDQDGSPEVILQLEINGYISSFLEVLHCIGDTVYGYAPGHRGYCNVNANGVFWWSGGAGSGSYCTMIFTEDGVTARSLASQDSLYDSDGHVTGFRYFIDGQEVTDTEYSTYVRGPECTGDPLWWYALTESRIAQLLG